MHLLMPFVVWLFGDSQVEWIVSCFVTKSHEVLSLPGTLVSGSMFFATMLPSATFVLCNNYVEKLIYFYLLR